MKAPKPTNIYELTDRSIEMLVAHSAPLFKEGVGERFRIARMVLKLDQRQVGKLMGVSVNVISSVERDMNTIRGSFSVKTFFETFGVATTCWILWAQNDQAMRERFKFYHSEYWKAKFAAQGNRIPWKDREEVKSKIGLRLKRTSLEMEVEELKKRKDELKKQVLDAERTLRGRKD